MTGNTRNKPRLSDHQRLLDARDKKKTAERFLESARYQRSHHSLVHCRDCSDYLPVENLHQQPLNSIMTETTDSQSPTSSDSNNASGGTMAIDDLLDAIRQKREEILESNDVDPVHKQQPLSSDNVAPNQDSAATMNITEAGDDPEEVGEDEVIEEVSVCTADLGPEDDLSYQEVWEEEIMEDDVDDDDDPFRYDNVSANCRPDVFEQEVSQETEQAADNDDDGMVEVYVEEEVTESQADNLDPVVVTETPTFEEPKEDLAPKEAVAATESASPISLDTTTPSEPLVVATETSANANTTAVSETAPIADKEKRKERYNKLGNRLKHIWKPPSEQPTHEVLVEPEQVKKANDDDTSTMPVDNLSNHTETPVQDKSSLETVPRKKSSSRRQKSISKMLGIRRSEPKDESNLTDAEIVPNSPDERLKKPTPMRQKSLSKLLGGGRQKSLSKQQESKSVDDKTSQEPTSRRQKSISKLLSGLRQKSDPDTKKASKTASRQGSDKSKNKVELVTEEVVTTTKSTTIPAAAVEAAVAKGITSPEEIWKHANAMDADIAGPTIPTERAPDEEKVTVKTSTRIVDGKAVTTTTKTVLRTPRQGGEKQDETVSVSQAPASTPASPVKSRSSFSPSSPSSPTTPRASPYRAVGKVTPPSPSQDIGWTKPEWTKPVLRKTKLGDAIRAGEK